MTLTPGHREVVHQNLPRADVAVAAVSSRLAGEVRLRRRRRRRGGGRLNAAIVFGPRPIERHVLAGRVLLHGYQVVLLVVHRGALSD